MLKSKLLLIKSNDNIVQRSTRTLLPKLPVIITYVTGSALFNIDNIFTGFGRIIISGKTLKTIVMNLISSGITGQDQYGNTILSALINLTANGVLELGGESSFSNNYTLGSSAINELGGYANLSSSTNIDAFGKLTSVGSANLSSVLTLTGLLSSDSEILNTVSFTLNIKQLQDFALNIKQSKDFILNIQQLQDFTL